MITPLKCLLLTSDSFEWHRISGKFDILNLKRTGKKKKKHTKKRSCWIVRSLWMTVFYGLGKTLLIGQQPWAPKQEAAQKLIPWEAENRARPTQPTWKPHRCVIRIFLPDWKVIKRPHGLWANIGQNRIICKSKKDRWPQLLWKEEDNLPLITKGEK